MQGLHNISVLVPTYRRSQDLRRCLEALAAQTRQADEVLVVVRDSDEETLDFLSRFRTLLPLRRVCIGVPGVVAAMNAGLQAASGDVVALTDDDSAPWPDWLARLEAHFAADPQVGGVGGRDWVYFGTRLESGEQPVVGKVQWFGRAIGFHHVGTGGARAVDFLKGVNCAYRIEPLRQIRFDERLWGRGAQVHWELALGLTMRRRGWKLIYDPLVGVDHFPSVRHDADQRYNMDRDVLRNAVHNETLALWSYLSPFARLCFLAWSLLLGSRLSPGFAMAVYLTLKRSPQISSRWLATIQGRWLGLKTYYQARG